MICRVSHSPRDDVDRIFNSLNRFIVISIFVTAMQDHRTKYERRWFFVPFRMRLRFVDLAELQS
jgi:hypothetical protein